MMNDEEMRKLAERGSISQPKEHLKSDGCFPVVFMGLFILVLLLIGG